MTTDGVSPVTHGDRGWAHGLAADFSGCPGPSECEISISTSELCMSVSPYPQKALHMRTRLMCPRSESQLEKARGERGMISTCPT